MFNVCRFDLPPIDCIQPATADFFTSLSIVFVIMGLIIFIGTYNDGSGGPRV